MIKMIMSMLRDLVLTEFRIYLYLQSCSCPKIRGAHFPLCHDIRQEMLITVLSDHALSPCGLIGENIRYSDN